MTKLFLLANITHKYMLEPCCNFNAEVDVNIENLRYNGKAYFFRDVLNVRGSWCTESYLTSGLRYHTTQQKFQFFIAVLSASG